MDFRPENTQRPNFPPLVLDLLTTRCNETNCNPTASTIATGGKYKWRQSITQIREIAKSDTYQHKCVIFNKLTQTASLYSISLCRWQDKLYGSHKSEFVDIPPSQKLHPYYSRSLSRRQDKLYDSCASLLLYKLIRFATRTSLRIIFSTSSRDQKINFRTYLESYSTSWQPHAMEQIPIELCWQDLSATTFKGKNNLLSFENSRIPTYKNYTSKQNLALQTHSNLRLYQTPAVHRQHCLRRGDS